MKEDEMGEAYSRHGRDEKFLQNFSYKTGREERTAET
jgi:hypothetical protein